MELKLDIVDGSSAGWDGLQVCKQINQLSSTASIHAARWRTYKKPN